MKFALYLFFIIALGIVSGCSTFSELSPRPPVSPAEGNYTELKKKSDSFELSKKDKYFIKFPGSTQDNMVLTLKSDQFSSVRSYLTSKFDDGKGEIIKTPELMSNLTGQKVWKLEKTDKPAFWVIDSVYSDFKLNIQYRYLPEWRFRYENRFDVLKSDFVSSKVNRFYLDSLGLKANFNGFDFTKELSLLEKTLPTLERIQSELNDTKFVIPSTFQNSADPAFLSWKDLDQSVSSELSFQTLYNKLLKAYKLDSDSRQNQGLLAENADLVTDLLQNLSAYPSNTQADILKTFRKSIPALNSWFDGRIRQKSDAKLVDDGIAKVETVYPLLVIQPEENFKAVVAFKNRFNRNVTALENGQAEFETIQQEVKNYSNWPSSDFYGTIVRKMDNLSSNLPAAQTSEYGKYAGVKSVSILNGQVKSFNDKFGKAHSNYRRASVIAGDVNEMKANGDFRGILSLLKKNQDLDFLIRQYRGLDEASVKSQKEAILKAIQEGEYPTAENLLVDFHRDTDFLDMKGIASAKNKAVKELEKQFLETIETRTKEFVNSFMAANLTTLDSVDSLYQNQVWSPIYELTFTTGKEADLKKKNQSIADLLTKLKTITFPETAIEALYKDFVSDISNKGVEKARAIVSHGKYYRGSDKKIKTALTEVDPLVAKWIVKPVVYRKIFVTPETTVKGGTNQYRFRLNLIPETDAAFPVWDINIKLPAEIAKNAGQESWFESITVNGKPVKNEGRFTIEAPVASNDYTARITPIQTNKGKENILEVRFTHKSFKVHEVSVMVQVPLIKKN